jgi:oligo-1,6-glucosidase
VSDDSEVHAEARSEARSEANAAADAGVNGEPWWKSAVIYQIYPRSFADSDGDGIGDLRGILGKVDYLRRLGVDAVWLSPIYRSPQDDNGYDISDYFDIDPVFGTLQDFDELVAAFHRAGIRLIMDLVVNHTSDEHPWFIESRASRTSPKRDWYIWRPARAGYTAGQPGAEPNNWESHFSGSAWELDPASGEYYLHIFSRKQPDLNWENPETREAVYEMMRWWLDRGVDGFRMDVINFISKDPGLPDVALPPGKRFADGGAFYESGPRVHEYLQEMHREVFAGRPQDPAHALLTVGEMPGSTIEQARAYTDPARGELDMIFQFEHVQLDHPRGKFAPIPVNVRALKDSLGAWQRGLAETGWNSLYWNNHDQPRAVSRFGDDGPYRERSAKALAAVLHLMRGTPYIYQGEELGMTNAGFTDISDYRDIQTLNYWRTATEDFGLAPAGVMPGILASSRDNARTPMQWTADEGAGFTTGTPWIRVNPNHESINADNEVASPGSVFAFYRRLIALRHEDPVVSIGDFTMLYPDHTRLFAYTRTLEHGRGPDTGPVSLLVMANFSEEPLELPVELRNAWRDAELVLGNLVDATPDAARDPGTLGSGTGGETGPFPPELAEWEARIYRRTGSPSAGS